MVKKISCLLCLMLASGVTQAELYRSVDADGKVVYSDRPAHAGHKPESQKAPNVASPEASRQIQEENAELIRRRNEEARRVNTKRPGIIQEPKSSGTQQSRRVSR